MKSYHYTFISLLLLAMACQDSPKDDVRDLAPTQEQTQVIFHKSHEPLKASAPFSDIVEVGGTYYLSGQIGMDHSTRTLVEGGIEAETRQTLENIKAVLAQHELQMRDVVKALVVLDDIDNFAAFNEIYQGYFPHKPARTTFAAAHLARGAKIEIEVVAVRR